jgi:hypothetical protein
MWRSAWVNAGLVEGGREAGDLVTLDQRDAVGSAGMERVAGLELAGGRAGERSVAAAAHAARQQQ